MAENSSISALKFMGSKNEWALEFAFIFGPNPPHVIYGRRNTC